MSQNRSPAAVAERRAPVDIGEFLRFIATGVIATIGNMTVMRLTRHFVDYSLALVAGMATGMAISFVLSKLFAFQSREWSEAKGEAGRFLIVYGFGITLFWIIAFVSGQMILPRIMGQGSAELLGVLMGAGIMTFTSYFGHRFYTYR